MSSPCVLAMHSVVATCQQEHGRRHFILQVDLESVLQPPGGKTEHFSETAALRAFSLHCRLSIHLQHKVCPVSPSGQSTNHLAKATPSLNYLFVVGQFCTEGKVYLSTLEDTGFWLESKVLSFIHDQEEDYLKRHRLIYQQIIQVSVLHTDLPPSGPARCFQTSFLFSRCNFR